LRNKRIKNSQYLIRLFILLAAQRDLHWGAKKNPESAERKACPSLTRGIGFLTVCPAGAGVQKKSDFLEKSDF
jgi:hypothetical protein